MTTAARQYRWLRWSVMSSGVVAISALMITAAYLGPVAQRALIPSRLSCGCLVMAIRPSWWVTISTVVLLSLALVTVGLFVWSLTKSIWRSRLQWQAWRRLGWRLVEHRQLHHPYYLIQASEPIAVTVGLWQPKMFLSTGLLRRLRGSEFFAVLRHEDAHRRARDPLMTAIMSGLTSALFWLPWSRSWMTQAYTWRELAADGVATDNYEHTAPLSAAFLKLHDLPIAMHHAAFSPNQDRLEKLLNHDWMPAKRIWRWSTAVAFIGLVVSMLTFSRYVRAATPSIPLTAATACHQTVTMCQAERRTLSTSAKGICQDAICVSFDRPLISTYAISWDK